MGHEKSFLCTTKDIHYSILIAFLAQYCTDLVRFFPIIAKKSLKGMEIYFYYPCFQKASSASTTVGGNQNKAEKEKENEAVNQHWNDVSGYFTPPPI